MNNLTKNYIERKEEFEKKITLSFFAKEDWEYDYKNNPSEFQFRMWQEKMTNIAKTKQDIVSSFQKSDILSVLDVIEKEIKESKTYTGCSSVEEKDDRINKHDLLQFVKEAKDEIIKN